MSGWELRTAFIPTNDKVVGHGHDPRSADGVVGADVGDDVDFGRDGHVGAEEFAEQRREGPADWP